MLCRNSLPNGGTAFKVQQTSFEPRPDSILVRSAEGVRALYEGVTTREEMESLLDAATSELRKQAQQAKTR